MGHFRFGLKSRDCRLHASNDQLAVRQIIRIRIELNFQPYFWTGQAEINRLIDAVENFSVGSALFEKGQSYLKIIDALRHSYMYIPRDYSDVFTSLKDFEMFLKRAKEEIVDELQNFIQFAEDAPWTARQTCQGFLILSVAQSSDCIFRETVPSHCAFLQNSQSCCP